MASQPVLAVSRLKVAFRAGHALVPVVHGLDLVVMPGETLALVGESGSGKSVASLAVMGLHDRRAAVVSGEILFRDKGGALCDLMSLNPAARARIRGAEIAMVFQEPMTALNPVQTVGAQIGEVMRLHEGLKGPALRARVISLLRAVEIADPARRVRAYPHELSGGMRQRVMIAMALACGPSLLIADEPTTALDVTVQRQILTLLRRAQSDLGMGLLVITHNLGVVAEIADRVAVMYAGRIVETAPAADLFRSPRHPYTRGLLACLPTSSEGGRGVRLKPIEGAVVDPRRPPPGCAFAPRCAMALDACRSGDPVLSPITAHHASRCLRSGEL